MTLKVEVIEYLCEFPCAWLANPQHICPLPTKPQTSLLGSHWVPIIHRRFGGQRVGGVEVGGEVQNVGWEDSTTLTPQTPLSPFLRLSRAQSPETLNGLRLQF